MESQIVDLLISHHQVFIRSMPYQNDLAQWGKGNLCQGMILHKNFVIFDPIAEGTFGARINLYLKKDFDRDENSKRAVAVPFYIDKNVEVFIGSVAEEYAVNLNLSEGDFMIFYEVCVKEEVYLNFTFIKTKNTYFSVLIDDEFGLKTTTKLVSGIF